MRLIIGLLVVAVVSVFASFISDLAGTTVLGFGFVLLMHHDRRRWVRKVEKDAKTPRERVVAKMSDDAFAFRDMLFAMLACAMCMLTATGGWPANLHLDVRSAFLVVAVGIFPLLTLVALVAYAYSVGCVQTYEQFPELPEVAPPTPPHFSMRRLVLLKGGKGRG